MMRDPYVILQEIRAAANRADNQALAALFLELGVSVLVFSAFPAQFFDALVALLRDSAFLAVENSWNLVYFIDGNWVLLEADQREALRDVLVGTFDKFHSFMGAFVIGEILGRQYGDDRALGALLNLSQVAEMPALALVPHGLETLARSTGDVRLRDRAVHALRELASSSVEEVRKEAGNSLGKVARPLEPT